MSRLDGHCNQANGCGLLASAITVVLLTVIGGIPPLTVSVGLGLTGLLYLMLGSYQLRQHYRNT